MMVATSFNRTKIIKMKKVFLLTVSVLFFGAAFGQQETVEYTGNQHVAKLNPLSFAFGKLSLGYEYVLDNNNSLALQLGIPLKTKLNSQIIEELESDNDLTLSSAEYKGFSIRPSYRVYTSKKKRGPRGLYFEPSIKYQKYDLDATGTYIDGPDSFNSKLEGEVSTFGLGAQLGAQWLIGDAFAIDFFFLGPEANFGDVELVYTDLDGDADLNQIKADLDEDWDDIPLLGEVTTTVDEANNTVTATTDGSFIPGLRFGINLGYSF